MASGEWQVTEKSSNMNTLCLELAFLENKGSLLSPPCVLGGSASQAYACEAGACDLHPY